MDKILNFKKFIEKNGKNKILKAIENKNDFEKFLDLFIENFSLFDSNKIEYILKIIFNQIVKFELKISANYLDSIYTCLKTKDNENLMLMSRFVTIYDELKSNKVNLLSFCYQIIRSFSEIFDELKKYKVNVHLKKKDFDNIHLILHEKFIPYYNSFFEVKYERYFFNRIIDCKSIPAQNIHTKEMVYRLKKLFNLFGKDLIKMLKIEIITVNDFWNYEYLKRINYYRIFYNKTNNFLKSFEIYYSSLNRNILEIDNLTTIHQINYVDKIMDSTSSIFLNDNYLDFNINNIDDSLNVFSQETFRNDFDNYDSDDEKYNDTPIFTMDNNEIEDLNIEDDNSIDNLFIKS